MPELTDKSGDSWRVYIGDDAPHPGVLPLIFHCTSNYSNGYRVVEVPEAEYASEGAVDQLSESELEELFGRAQPFDFTHDPKAAEGDVGDTPLR